MGDDGPRTRLTIEEETRMDKGHEPATKADIEQLRSESHHAYDDLKETIRDAQTELLTAFYGWAKSTDAKFKESEIADLTLRQRITALECRLTEVEKRLNLPPQ
jgi:hypothetical protein